MNYTKKDIQKFDELLSQTELKGINREYNRPLARLKLKKFLSKFTQKEQDEMVKKIGTK